MKTPLKIEKPNRVSHTYTQIIKGSIEQIMPLYCPVRELDWCENWKVLAVFSNSGLVEKDCIFLTPDNESEIVWIVTDYNMATGLVKMFYIIPEVLVTKLEIRVTATTETTTKAVLTYTKTSLSKAGDNELKSFTKDNYDTMMDSWEKAMNHYLETGEMLTGLPNF